MKNPESLDFISDRKHVNYLVLIGDLVISMSEHLLP